MADKPKDIPKRAVYKPAEVCEAAHIQPYVLRSWEAEFPRLGVVRSGVRVYRQADLDQVLRIRQLVFEEGLTLAGARRRIEEDREPQPELPLDEPITPEMRERIGHVKEGLQQLLSLLGGEGEHPAADETASNATARVERLEPERATEERHEPPAPKKRSRKPPAPTRPKATRGRRHASRA